MGCSEDATPHFRRVNSTLSEIIAPLYSADFVSARQRDWGSIYKKLLPTGAYGTHHLSGVKPDFTGDKMTSYGKLWP
jgi:hypothetical protein